MTQSLRSDVVTATVPVDWLHLFIGHRLWSKPEHLGHSAYGYHTLLDVVHESTGDPNYPTRIKAVIEFEGARHLSLIPSACTVQDVTVAECECVEYDSREWFKWVPQFRTIPTDSGEQYALL